MSKKTDATTQKEAESKTSPKLSKLSQSELTAVTGGYGHIRAF